MGRPLLPLLAAFLSLGLLLQPLTGSPQTASPAVAARSPAYLALGDSIAFGVGASDPGKMGYVARVYDALRSSDRYKQTGLDLVNLSVPGAVSADLVQPGGQLDLALNEIKSRLVDTASPRDGVDIISIDIGGNDLLTLATRDSPCITASDSDACRQRLRQVLSGLQDNLTRVLKALRDAAPQATIVLLDLYNPYSGTGDPRDSIADPGVQQINGVLGAIAADASLRIDNASVFQLFQGRGGQWIAADGIHPNDDGHAVIAEAVLAAIEHRAPNIPQALLSKPTGSAPDQGRGADAQSSDSGGSDTLILLAVAIPVSFAAGALLSGAYFIARGRG